MIVCPKCHHENKNILAKNCSNCGINLQWALEHFQDEEVKEKLQEMPNLELDQRANKIICTTAPSLEGYRVTKTLEVISAECVFGMNIFRDFFASLTDFFGGRSEASQKVLRDARKTCLWELKKEAAKINANAVIAISLDYSEFSGGGKSMLFLVANGTAVRTEPIVRGVEKTEIRKV